MEAQEKSHRYESAEMIASFVNDNNLSDSVCSIHRGVDRKSRAYYSINFSTAFVDGNISVYSHKYFVMKFRTKLKFLPTEATLLLKNKDDLLSFMKTAFVDQNSASTEMMLNNVHFVSQIVRTEPRDF